MITELLLTGRENALTGRELATILDCNIRVISQQVERERRQGQPICASCDSEHPGYYLAADEDELKHYCDRLYRRGGELFKTRRALIKALQELQAKNS